MAPRSASLRSPSSVLSRGVAGRGVLAGLGGVANGGVSAMGGSGSGRIPWGVLVGVLVGVISPGEGTSAGSPLDFARSSDFCFMANTLILQKMFNPINP